MTTTRRYLAVLLVVGLTVATGACDRSSSGDEAAAAEAAPAPAPGAPVEGVSRPPTERPRVDAPVFKLGTEALARALSRAIGKRRADEAPFVEAFDASFRALVSKEKAAKKVLERVYEGNGYTFVFADGSALTPGARELLHLVEELPSHGIATEPYHLDELRVLFTQYDAASAGYLELRGKELPGAAGKLRTIFELTKGQPTPEELAPGLREAGLSDADVDAVQQVVDLQGALFEAKKTLNDTLQKLDVRLLTAYFRYALDFRYVKIAHPWRAMRKPASAYKVYGDKLLADLEAGKDSVDATLRSWWPDHPLYERTRAGLAFYTKLAEDGRFVELPSRSTRRGQKGDHVRKLQQRLAAEGYFNGPLDGVFDDRLDRAVRLYQTTHQLDVDGIVAGTTLKSMNKRFKDRISDIELSLQRWRESDARGEKGMFVRVNIPQFQAEFWEDGKLLRRFNVVVGSNAWEIDPDRRVEGNLNRTMLFSSAMETVVVNPTWSVPSRIRDTELMKLAEKDPEYWAKHNYVLQTDDDGNITKVYQKSGSWNALGLVKFLFPNDYSIYMHDTNLKHLFKNTIRAYSHGCMRVENALDMARFVFEKDGRLTPEEFERVLKSRTERGFTLRRKIPVHVEYNTVSVDDDGHVMFFLDVYKYDQAFRDGAVPIRGPKPMATDG